MIQLADNIGYLGPKPNFDRDYFLTCELMKAVEDTQIDDGHISYCAETKTHYEYRYDNPVDPRFGKWRVFHPIDVNLDPNSTNPVQNKSLYLLWNDLTSSFARIQKQVQAMVEWQLDEKLDPESENGVQNRVIYTQFDILGKEIASVSNALKDYIGPHEMLDHIEEEAIYPVQSGVLYTRFKEVDAALADLQQQINDTNFDVDELKEEINAEIKELREDIEATISEKVQQHIEDISNLRQDIEDLIDEAIQDHIDDILDIEGKLTDLENKHDQDIETLTGRIDKVEPLDTELSETSDRPLENKAIYAAFKEVEDREINLEGKLEETKETLQEEIQSSTTELKGKLNEVDEKIDALGDSVKEDLTEAISGISTQLEALDGKIDSNQEKLEESLKSVEDKIDELSESIGDDLKDAIEGLETKISSVESKVDGLGDTINDIVETQLTSVSEELEKIEEQVKGVDEKVDKLDPRLEDMEELLFLLVPITINFSPEIPVISLLEETNVTLNWNCIRAGKDITDECEFEVNDEAVEGTSMTVELNPTREEIYHYTLKVKYKGLTHTAETQIYAMPSSFYGAWTPSEDIEELIPTADDILGLEKIYIEKPYLEATDINLDHQSFIFAFPTSIGKIKSITDGSGFEYFWDEGGFSHIILELETGEYNVYFLNTPCKLSEFKFIFQ